MANIDRATASIGRTTASIGRTACLARMLLLMGMTSTAVFAEDSAGLYLGGSFGLSHVRSEGDVCCVDWRFSRSFYGWSALAGVRPLPYLGFEAAYIDFGRTSGPKPGSFAGSFAEHSSQKAAAVFAVGYLPLSRSNVDVYGKLGAARLRTDVQITYGPFSCPAYFDCAPVTVEQDHWSTNLAYGAGVQGKWGPLVVRGEYERINAGGGDPDLLSLGAIWRF
jgi:opacity protein-like surface antigen